MNATHLPIPSTSLIARESELAEINRLLATPACRLLTLTGAGGMGKTRLALEAAHRMMSEKENLPLRKLFSDGIYFVPLQPISGPDFIVSTLIDVMQMPFMGAKDAFKQMLDNLRSRHVLMVMDNFDHLMEGTDLLAGILETAPNVKLLVTSRERLHLHEEWVISVGGLAFPDKGQPLSPAPYSAVQLFTETARRAGYACTETDQASIARICQLVEGIPLAIELAAAWTRVMPCDEIAREIERSLDILTTSVRNVPEKHRSMRAAFEHSWKLLPEAEQQVFRQLSVFRGGFRREGSEGVTGASLPMLVSLVDRSMLRVDANGRYSFQELLRQYASHQLELAGETQAAQQAHCLYYADFLHRRLADLKGSKQIQALDEIAAELDNVRVSWRWAAENGNQEAIAQACDSLFRFYQIRSYYREGADTFEMAVNCFGNLENEMMAELYLRQAWFFHYRGRRKELKSLRKGLELRRRFGIETPVAMPVRQMLFYVYEFRGYEVVQQVFQKWLASARKHGDAWGEAWMLHCLSELAVRHGKPAEAQPFLEMSMERFRILGDRWGMSWSVSAMGLVLQGLNQFDKALHFHQEHLALCEECGDIAGVAYAFSQLGFVLQKLGEPAVFERYVGKVLIPALESGYTLAIANALHWAACHMTSEGHVQSVELFALLLHQYGDRDFKESIRGQLDSLKTEMPAEIYEAALQRGRSSDLETAAAALVEQFGTVDKVEPAALRSEGRTGQQDTLLNERELEILRLVADGLNSREIAQRLHLGVTTIRWYLRQIYSKLDVHSRSEALARAKALNLLE